METDSQNSDLCPVCFDPTKSRIQPCSHKLCNNCYQKIEQKRCPICRTIIESHPEGNKEIKIDLINSSEISSMNSCCVVVLSPCILGQFLIISLYSMVMFFGFFIFGIVFIAFFC